MCGNLIPGHTYYEHSVWPQNWMWQGLEARPVGREEEWGAWPGVACGVVEGGPQRQQPTRAAGAGSSRAAREAEKWEERGREADGWDRLRVGPAGMERRERLPGGTGCRERGNQLTGGPGRENRNSKLIQI
jgi:hypothetical protein